MATADGERLNLALVCGFLGFRNIGPIEYFNGVAEYLTQNYPVRVTSTATDPTRGVEYRGDQLRQQILIALGEVPPETREERQIAGTFDPALPVHIIAHSMGSLDSRYLLSPGNPSNLGDRVTTLSMVGGPHRGTPIADLLYEDIEGVGLNLVEKEVARLLRKLIADAGASLDGLKDLTVERCAAFNAQYGDHPDVRYFSVAGGGYAPPRDPTSHLLGFSWRYIHKVTDEVNDGAVPLSSARWGDFNPDLWAADHPGLIGHDVDHCGAAPKDFDYLARYGQLVEQLLAL